MVLKSKARRGPGLVLSLFIVAAVSRVVVRQERAFFVGLTLHANPKCKCKMQQQKQILRFGEG
jgi:hypothetical protein